MWVPWYQQSTYRPTHFFLPVANMVCIPSLPQNMGHQGPFLPALCGDACACSCLCCVHASRLASLGSLRGIGESKPGWPPNSNDPHIHGQHRQHQRLAAPLCMDTAPPPPAFPRPPPVSVQCSASACYPCVSLPVCVCLAGRVYVFFFIVVVLFFFVPWPPWRPRPRCRVLSRGRREQPTLACMGSSKSMQLGMSLEQR